MTSSNVDMTSLTECLASEFHQEDDQREVMDLLDPTPLLEEDSDDDELGTASSSES